MQVDLVRVDRAVGEVRVHVVVTLRGHKPEAITVTMPEHLQYVKNHAGWMQDVDGNWRSPFRPGKQDNWEPFIDPKVKWARRTPTDDELFGAAIAGLEFFGNIEVADHCVEVGFSEYVDQQHKVRIVPKGPVHVDEDTGFVQVEIEAYDLDSGATLWVDDGFWAFHNLDPIINGSFDAAEKLRKVLAQRVREEQP